MSNRIIDFYTLDSDYRGDLTEFLMPEIRIAFINCLRAGKYRTPTYHAPGRYLTLFTESAKTSVRCIALTSMTLYIHII